MNWIEKLIRPDLRGLKGYSSARSEAGGFVPEIAVDANENPWPPFGSLGAACHANRYPEPQPAALCRRLATVWGAAPEQIILGRGSDDGIDILLRLFCRAGADRIMVCPPTFGVYQVFAAIQGAEVVKVPLNQDWQLDLPAMLKACTPETKLIFIPSPNAPMGHWMREADLLALCRERAEQSLIVVDEAYVEFTSSPEGLVPKLADHPNLAILRTMSKAQALAGERVGAVIAAPEIIEPLQKVRAAYPLTQSSIRAALEALSPNGVVEAAERRRILIAERERLARLLPQSPHITGIYPSVTNFLLVQTPSSAAFMQHLQRFGILARNRHGDIPGTVRLTVGTPEENNLVLRALGVTLETPASSPRLFSARRVTKETAISVTVNLDSPNFLKIETGIGFFDHMLSQLASHGGFGLELHCQGDLVIDQHHSIEDCALALGEALRAALGDKRGVARFGFSAPLDEALAQVVIDLSGRPHAGFEGTLPAPTVGGMSSEMVPHFFQSLANSLGAAIHVKVEGDNTHHMVESCFKATGRALRQAFRREGDTVPSTKGVL